jgi:hypothetical protein
MSDPAIFIDAAETSNIVGGFAWLQWRSGAHRLCHVFPLVEYRAWLAAETAHIDRTMAERGQVVPMAAKRAKGSGPSPSGPAAPN